MLNYRIENREAFKVIGKSCYFNYEEAYDCIPEFWKDWMANLENEMKSLSQTNVGTYGISIETPHGEKDFVYYIAGDYQEGLTLEGYEVVEIPALTWAIFSCTGPMPEALQTLNTSIFQEWLTPENPYQLAAGYNIEWYEMGDVTSESYQSEIWVPVKKK